MPDVRSCKMIVESQSGASLIEILTTVAILALVTALGVPYFASYFASAAITTAANDMLASLLLARSEAMKRNQSVAICTSTDGVNCTSSGGWEQGWIVFVDSDKDGTRSSTEAILSRRQPLGQGTRLVSTSGVDRYVAYVPSGTTKQVSGGFQSGTISVCKFSGASQIQARQIVINTIGRPRVQSTSSAVTGC